MSDSSKDIYVYADWQELKSPLFMGCLHSQYTRGKEVFSFEFAPEWLKQGSALLLDPDLLLYAGRQYSGSVKKAFGIFMDSSPDRWGRQLIRRREAIQARAEMRPLRSLAETDYLLGLHDATRMGALRFKLDKAGEFLSNEMDLPAPPWASLHKLEAACRHYEEDSLPDDEHEKWLNMLLAPGSSLGGARPKANIADNDGNLWIAKFPSRSDDTNIGAWEMVTHRLAGMAELSVPECRIEKFSGHGSTFLTKRFDRIEGRRIHFASAMTLLGRSDGDNHDSGCSYLDLAQFIVQHGANPNKDLQELWKRIVFSIAVSNTDDHLRNHGFLLNSQGWILSPAYDINPNPHGSGLSLNVSEDDNSLDFDLALSVASQFRFNQEQATQYIFRVKKTVNSWNEVAMKINISRREIGEMSAAFS